MIALPSTLGLVMSQQIVFDGIIRGMIYGLIGIGIVLIFRASGVINFAQGQFGAFSAAIMALLFVNYDIPMVISFPAAIITGAVIGSLTEFLVVRRLFKQPRLFLLIATVGVAQVLLLLQFQLPTTAGSALSGGAVNVDTSFPTPWENRYTWGNLNVRGDQLMVLICVPVIVAVLALLLQRTRFGLSVRSAADNPNAASLAGIKVKSVSTQVWALAGALAAASALLAGPVLNQQTNEITTALGPNLLLFALAAALVGGMTSFPLTLLGGIGLGLLDIIVFVNTTDQPGTNILVLFIVVVALVLVRARSQRTDESAWTLTPRSRQGEAELLRHPVARVVRFGGMGLLLAAGLALPQFESAPSRLIEFSDVLVFLIVALSATVLVGWAGQLSLGQYAFVAVGGYLTAYYGSSLGFLPSIGLATLWGVVIAVIIGIPALRISGFYLAIVTLGFALMVSGYLLLQDRFNNSIAGFGARLEPPKVFGIDFASDKEGYYYFCFAATLLVMLIVVHFRRTGVGRSLLAVRDNEANAAAYTVSPARAKLIAFGLSGGIAAFAGGLFAAGHVTMQTPFFEPSQSLRVLAVAVVGGLSSVTGAVLGTIVIIALPTIFHGSQELQLFASGIGMLILLMYCPGGLITVVHAGRDMLLGWLERKSNWKPKTRAEGAAIAQLSTRSREDDAKTADLVPLLARDVRVQFRGRYVVDGVNLEVRPGEVVGLIGTNGAGKTTLMNAISGFVKSTGEIEVYGRSVGRKPAFRRARYGMARAFQNARGFGGLTVREAIQVALEARQRSLLLPSLVALPPSPQMERRKRREADEIISYLGLGRYANSLMMELSTGTRRIVELGALLALDSKLFLLDEPTAGVAQKETEAFGPLIKAIQAELGSSILIIEHDMPMVMSISDRIYCLEAGKVIAEGNPGEVRENPAVVSSYLGTDERAIQRSGAQSS